MRYVVIIVSLGLACTPDGGPDFMLSGGGTGNLTAAPESDSTLGESSGTSGSRPGASGTGSAGGEDAGSGSSETGAAELGDDAGTGASTTGVGASSDAATQGAETDGAGSTGEPFDGVIDIGIVAHNDCTFTVEPASIAVPEGTAFSVNWVSAATSEVEFDVAKIDPFNQVPILLGMEPGDAYHDEVHDWCGNLFNGTFEFRLTSCFDPTYIPVDCGG